MSATPQDGKPMNGADNAAYNHWALDKRVPVAVLIALAGQLIGFVWMAATMSANVSAMGKRVEDLEKNNALMLAQSNAIAAMDAKVSAAQEGIREVKSMVMGLMSAGYVPLKERPAK